MVERDAAFLWETEALRTMTMPVETQSKAAPVRKPEVDVGWVPLREASEATGIPVATLRSWIRKKRIPSVIDETPNGARRLVPLDRVQARARALGREIGDVVDLRPHEPAPAAPAALAESTPPPGTMIVPIEAWDKMLLQLGNLHEAGQQLAEARERAARAETEAIFLKERLAEMRAARDEAVAAAEQAAPVEAPAQTQRETRPSFTAYLWRSATSRLRRV